MIATCQTIKYRNSIIVFFIFSNKSKKDKYSNDPFAQFSRIIKKSTTHKQEIILNEWEGWILIILF
jgi:hypothetical protein